MSEWWTSLSFEQQFYYAIAIVATTLVLFQLMLMMFGFGADELADAGDVDMDGPEDHPSGIHLLSSRTVVAFFVGFGWAGAMRAGEGASTLVTAGAGVAAGTLFGYAIFRLMGFLDSLRHSGTLNYENAVGEVGTVYLPVHPAMAGGGQIQVMIQGRLKVVAALTRAGAPIEQGSRVRVVGTLDRGTLLVDPLSAAPESMEE